jgi:hypothetical protein
MSPDWERFRRVRDKPAETYRARSLKRSREQYAARVQVRAPAAGRPEGSSPKGSVVSEVIVNFFYPGVGVSQRLL